MLARFCVKQSYLLVDNMFYFVILILIVLIIYSFCSILKYLLSYNLVHFIQEQGLILFSILYFIVLVVCLSCSHSVVCVILIVNMFYLYIVFTFLLYLAHYCHFIPEQGLILLSFFIFYRACYLFIV